MKKIYLLLLVALIVAACQKDTLGGSGTLRITAEGMHGASKVAVNGTVSYWASDDQVLINGEQVTVNIDEPNNTVTVNSASSFEAPFFGVYPAGIYVSNSGADYTLNLPSSYTYATTTHYGRTLQNLPSPMVAYLATAGDNPVLEFKHVTGALNVMVINHYGFTIQVDSIVVSSNKYQLCGSKTVTLGNDISVNAVETNDESLRRVKLVGGTALRVLAGDTAIIQLPVLPVGPDNRFTVEVGVRKNDDVKKKFKKTQGNSGTNYSLGRAEIGYVPTRFGGLFSVNATKKVIISQGNLCYNKSSQKWSFLSSQNDIEESDGSVGGEYTTTGKVTLFGWGTSGWDNGNVKYMPYNTSNAASGDGGSYGYGPTDGSSYFYSLTGTYAHADWGVHNAISNGGNVAGRWRTLTSGQWDTLFTKRTTTGTVNGTSGARFAFAKVNNKNGIILFPDEFEPPSLHAGSYWGTINDKSDWTTNIISIDWYLLEAEGAVFLPAAGTRFKTDVRDVGYKALYWSSNHHTSQVAYAYGFSFQSNKLTVKESDKSRNYGASVRLVHDMN